MQITDILARMGGLQSMARELGISEAQPAGLEGLGGLLGQLGGGSLLDDVLSPQPTNVNLGNDVLGQMFGTKDVSRTVAQNASAKSGLDPSILKKMLPILAMLVAGYMAKQRSGGAAAPSPGGGLGDLLGGLVGGGARSPSAPAAGASGGLGSLLDLDGHGNALDDILGMAGKLMR